MSILNTWSILNLSFPYKNSLSFSLCFYLSILIFLAHCLFMYFCLYLSVYIQQCLLDISIFLPSTYLPISSIYPRCKHLYCYFYLCIYFIYIYMWLSIYLFFSLYLSISSMSIYILHFSHTPILSLSYKKKSKGERESELDAW